MRRHWKRDFVRAFEAWRSTGIFDRSVLIDAMNNGLDQEIRDLYQLLAVCGALEVTIDDLEYHVNYATGSDVTGDGSATNPYASMWFLPYLPATIRHHVRILIEADHTEYTINTSRFSFEQDGFLNFVGVSAPEVLSENHEVSAVLTNYNGFLFTAPVALEEALSGGWWLQKTSAGLYQTWAAPILSNKTDTLWVPAGDGTELIPNIGDICRIIRPALSLTVENLILAHKATTRRTGATYASARVAFCNLRIDVDMSASGISENALVQAPTAFTFCRLNSNISLRMEGKINEYPSIDAALDVVSATGIKNLSSSTAGVGPGVNTSGLILYAPALVMRNGSLVRDAVIDADIFMYGNARLRAIGVRGEINCINCTLSDEMTGIDQYAGPISWLLCLVPADAGNNFNIYNSTVNIRNVRFVNRTGETNYCFAQAWGLCNITLCAIGQDTNWPLTFPHTPPSHGIVLGTNGTRDFMGLWFLEWDPTSADVNLDVTVAGQEIRIDDGIPTYQAWPAARGHRLDPRGWVVVVRGAV
ncbi:MAG: hypothetical protein PHT59_04230 [Candidatus Omnitrophica bacterium]|nr:hypothetical protein [Candidatus Omnitrophota bacterium]